MNLNTCYVTVSALKASRSVSPSAMTSENDSLRFVFGKKSAAVALIQTSAAQSPPYSSQSRGKAAKTSEKDSLHCP